MRQSDAGKTLFGLNLFQCEQSFVATARL